MKYSIVNWGFVMSFCLLVGLSSCMHRRYHCYHHHEDKSTASKQSHHCCHCDCKKDSGCEVKDSEVKKAN